MFLAKSMVLFIMNINLKNQLIVNLKRSQKKNRVFNLSLSFMISFAKNSQNISTIRKNKECQLI